MIISEIENGVIGWIQSLGMTPIVAYPGAGRPIISYVLINVLLDTQLGTEESDGNIIPIYSSLNQVTISLNTYYAGALHAALHIKKSLMTLAVDELLWTAGLGFATATPVQKMTEEIDKKWEERAQFDVVFNIREKTEVEDIGQIEKIEVNNETVGD